MSSHLLTVNRDTRLSEALKLMVDNHLDCLPVTEGNLLIGLVTSHDMLQVLSALLKKESARDASSPLTH